MTFYMKNFVFAALFYLGLAAIFGILNGVMDLGYWGVFAHSHFNLLGFMSMIVFGIGYFILPRFNGTELRFENWIPIHFYLGNISLIGMVVFRGLAISTGEDYYHLLFVICAILQVTSIFMFIVNIWITLSPKKVNSEPTPAPVENKPAPVESKYKDQIYATNDDSTMPNIPVTPESKIGDLIERLPSLKQVFIDSGLLGLQVAGHIDKVQKMEITIEMAAKNHSLDIDKMILALETELQKNGFSTNVNLDEMKSEPAPENVELNLNVLIGDVIANYPTSRDIFEKHFGGGCFDCPGQSYESIDMACRMHGIDPEQFLQELKDVI